MSWQPQDDPEYWDRDTGERAYQGNPSALRWRIVGPDGFRWEADPSGDEPMTSRDDAVRVAWAIAPDRTARCLQDMDREIAGWAKIYADGWRIEPMGKVGKA